MAGPAASSHFLAFVASAGGISAEDFIKRRAALRRLVNLYEHQAGNLAKVERARNRRAELAREAAAWVRFPDPPPYSLVLTDRLREEIDAEQLRIQAGEAAGATLSRIIEENEAILAQAEGRLRQLQEAIEAQAKQALAQYEKCLGIDSHLIVEATAVVFFHLLGREPVGTKNELSLMIGHALQTTFFVPVGFLTRLKQRVDFLSVGTRIGLESDLAAPPLVDAPT